MSERPPPRRPSRGSVASTAMALLAATATSEMRWLNGQPFLAMQGLVNRRRHEVEDIERILSLVCRRLPGSYGLLFHRSDDMDVPPGAGAFAVTVMARENLERRLDPFLSPTQPVVED